MAGLHLLPTRRSSGDTLDNLTHSLAGAVISKIGAERATPLATATLVVAANAPDVDVFSYLRGEDFALAFRRGITHGWLALLIFPFLVTAAMLAWDRWIRRRRRPEVAPARPRQIFVLSAVGVVTHPALDWLNTYGMRWGLPFDGSWSYGDALFIIDPWIWLALGSAMFLAKRQPRAVVVPVCAVAMYVGSMIMATHSAQTNVLEAARAEGLRVEDVLVAPRAGNPFAANVEIQTADAFVPGTHDWLRTPRVQLRLDRAVPRFTAPEDMPDTVAQRVARAAQEDPHVRDYLVWSRYPYVRVMPNDSGWTVRISDARYDSQLAAGGLAGLSVHVSSSDIR